MTRASSAARAFGLDDAFLSVSRAVEVMVPHAKAVLGSMDERKRIAVSLRDPDKLDEAEAYAALDRLEVDLEDPSILTSLVVARMGLNPTSGDITVNMAGLTIGSLPDRLIAHTLRPDVAELVGSTDLRSVPVEPPRILRRSCIVEVAHPERGERLFGDTVGIGCYLHKDRYYILGLGYPDGGRATWWAPAWGSNDVARGAAADLDEPDGSLVRVRDRDAHRAWAEEAARFLLVFGLLLDAAGAPIRVDDESSRKKGPPLGKNQKPPPAWVTRHVSLTKGAPVRSAVEAADGTMMTPDRIPAKTSVSGHLKRQRHGPGNADVRWIYVQAYEARRWLAPRPVRVTVTI